MSPDKLAAIIETTLGATAAEQRPESNLRQDLGADEFDMLLVVMAIEEAAGVELSDDDVAGIDTLGQLQALVERKVAA